MKTQQFSNLIELAKSLKWLVWAYDVPDYSKVEPGTDRETAKLIAPRKRVYVLRSPNNVPFKNGEPVAAQKVAENHFKFEAPARETEFEAWQDLPESEDLIREHSQP